VRKENLRGPHAVLGETAFVDLRQAHLANGSSGLQFVNFTRPLGPAQPMNTLGNRTGTDQHDFLALPAQRGNLRGPTRDGRVVEPSPVVGHQARSHFHYESLRSGYDGTHLTHFSSDLPR
jgi:hypothetical protein